MIPTAIIIAAVVSSVIIMIGLGWVVDAIDRLTTELRKIREEEL